MSEIKDGGPAFPSLEIYEGYDRDREAYAVKSDVATGMSLRDHFAGQALVGLLHYTSYQHGAEWAAAQDAYRIADAMIKAREQQ